ncbi:MAG: flagellar basal body rod modification protein [Candidatus Kapaibacterium sp.]
MNRRHVLPLLFLSTLLLSAALFFILKEGSEPSLSGGTDPEISSERIRWEWERLRDPATGKIPADIRRREIAFSATLPRREQFSPLLKSAGNPVSLWVQRGPWNVGGRTRGVSIDVANDQMILAGGVSGGMWKSDDGGESWRMVTRPDQLPSVTTVAQDRRPGKTETWYFGSGELWGNSASGGGSFWHGDGIFKSTDNGESWFALESTSSGTPQTFNVTDNIWRIATDPSNLEQDEVYAAIYGRIIRSVDGGETWQEVLKPSSLQSSSYFTDVAVTSTGVVYATLSRDGGKRGIYRSENGTSFTNITPSDIPSSYNRIVIGIAPSNENVVYFLGETPGSGFLGRNFRGDSSWQSLWKYTYISGNGSGDGGMWENRSANLPSFTTETAGNGDLFTQGGYDLHVRVKPDDENVVFIGGTNLYRSTDGFASTANTSWIGGFRDWKRDSAVIEEYSYPDHHADQHDVIFSPTDPNVMYSASDGGVHKTLDCTADSIFWISLNSGYLTTQFYAIAIDQGTKGSQTIMGGLQDNGTWRTHVYDNRAPWIRTGSSDGAYCAISDGGKYLYVSKQQGRIYRVEVNELEEETGSTRIDPAGATGYRFINPFILDPNDSRVMYLPVGKSIHLNKDVTAIPLDSKEPTSLGWSSLSGSQLDTGEITCISASKEAPASRLWYGTNDGRVFRMDDALGENPVAVEVTGTNFPTNGFVSCISVDYINGDRAIVAFSNYSIVSLYETTDGGETWTPVSGNLEENPDGSGAGPSVRWITILHRGLGTLYLAGTSTGLYTTTALNGEETIWEKEGAEEIGNVVVDMIVARPSDGFVAIGTHGNGVFSSIVPPLGVEEGTGSLGTRRALSLRQNVPNPMDESTRISFTVPDGKPLPVNITLFNAEGRKVATLAEGVYRPGEQTIIVNREVSPGNRLTPGLYFYRLQSGEVSLSRPLHVR